MKNIIEIQEEIRIPFKGKEVVLEPGDRIQVITESSRILSRVADPKKESIISLFQDNGLTPDRAGFFYVRDENGVDYSILVDDSFVGFYTKDQVMTSEVPYPIMDSFFFNGKVLAVAFSHRDGAFELNL